VRSVARTPRFSILLVAALVIACGGGGDGGTNPPPPNPNFSISLSSTTLTIEAGGTGTVTATIARTGGFAGTVNLTVENVPPGITPTFAPAAITSTTTQTTLTVVVAGTVTPGTHTFTVRGQGAGIPDSKTGTVTLTVTARPAIAMTLSATSASVQQGVNATYTANIARTNFTAAVTVAVTGAPAGVTPSVTNAGDVYTIALAVAGNTAPGTYPLVTTATGGTLSATATFTLTVTPAPASIRLTANPTAVTVQQGGPGVPTTLNIERISFTGTVVVAVQSGLPAGVTTAVNPTGPTLATQVTMTFTASGTAAPGTYNVVVQGAGFQAQAGLVTIALTVDPPAPTISISANPSALTVQRGNTGNTTIDIARVNFPTAVTLVATGVPAGVTPTFAQSPTTANSSVLSLAVSAAAPTGPHTITVTASGTGVANATTTVTLTIVAAPVGGNNITFTFCGAASDLPIFFAAQSGTTGPWVAVAPGPNNTFVANINTAGGVAWVKQLAANDFALAINYGTVAELTAMGQSQCRPVPSKSVTGMVAGLTALTDIASISLGSGFALPPPTFATPNFTISNVPDGVRDLLGTRSALNLGDPQNPLTLNKVYIRRGLNPANNSSIGTVDFNGTDAFAPETRALTINGLAGGEMVSVSNTFFTNTMSVAGLGFTQLTTGNVANISVVPAAKTVAGDVQSLAINAAVIQSQVPTQLRSIAAIFRDPTNQTITLGAVLNTPTVTTVATAPYARLRTQLTRQSDYQNSWSTSYSQQGNAPRSGTIQMSDNYIGSAAAFDVTLPDFSGLTGWQNTWGPQAGVSIFWNVSAFGWLTGNGQGLVDGVTYRIGQRQGNITP
jgi:hypothetical protein